MSDGELIDTAFLLGAASQRDVSELMSCPSPGEVRRHPKFCEAEIELAQLFKAYGLEWSPAPGQYVLDQSGLIECASPFQGRVFFILDLKHFVRRCGTLEELKQRMCWLPDWDDARQILRELAVDGQQIAERLQSSRALESGTERLELFRLIEESLTGSLDR